ncbi:MAG: DeoR/GlpR transcriptional regulator [Pirellulales bacterium]|nr:DeoR/GlpR transcriptional regulator [Pirellulales bacterium]
MLAEERRNRIYQRVAEAGSVSALELEQEFDVSTMTIWRDLNILEAEGKVLRVHGGAVRVNAAEPVAEPRFCERKEINSREKNAIARYAVEHFLDFEDILIMDSGTTVASMVPYLSSRSITILTNGLNLVNIAAASSPDLTLMCSGGILKENTKTFVGPQAEGFFREHRAKTMFFSVAGLIADEGITDRNPLEIQVKQAMASGADRRILLIDSSKFGIRSLAQVLPLNALNHLVTDSGAPKKEIEEIKAMGLDVHVTP